MLKICLTGGIGTGKTEASNILQTLGATVINADEVAHSFYAPGMLVWQEIVDEFGEDTFKIIDHSPELLTNIKGVGSKQKKSLL